MIPSEFQYFLHPSTSQKERAARIAGNTALYALSGALCGMGDCFVKGDEHLAAHMGIAAAVSVVSGFALEGIAYAINRLINKRFNSEMEKEPTEHLLSYETAPTTRVISLVAGSTIFAKRILTGVLATTFDDPLVDGKWEEKDVGVGVAIGCVAATLEIALNTFRGFVPP